MSWSFLDPTAQRFLIYTRPQVIHMPDTSYEAFEMFVKILYSEPVNLDTTSFSLLDQLYNLAEKYLVFEMQASLMVAVEVNAHNYLADVQDIVVLFHVTSDNPVKEALAEGVIEFLDRPDHYVLGVLPFLATAFYSGLYSDGVKEAIVRGAGEYIFINADDGPLVILSRIPQSEDNSKFMHMLIQRHY